MHIVQGLTQSQEESKLSWLRALLREPKGRREEKKPKCCSRKRPFSRPTLPGLFHKLKASEICKGHSGQNQSSKGRQKRHIGGCALKQGCQIPMRTHRKLWNFLRKKKNTLILKYSNNILHFILGGAPSP